MHTKVLAISLLLSIGTMLRAQVGLSADELKLFNLLNQERKTAGLPQFQWNYHLAEAARAHSQLMAQRKLLSHQFEGEPALGERLGATAARFNGAAENVAEADISPDTAGDVHAGLMNSPEHRANILSPKYIAVGLAAITRDGVMYVTEDFAHTVTVYSETQFRDAVIAAFNKARRARSRPVVTVVDDPRIHDLACSEKDKPQIPQTFSTVVEEVVFTSSEPDKFPAEMQKAIDDPGLHRMSLGVCFHPDKQHGFANFWVIAAFYP
jgi:uncharacterized protein YkwD